MKPTYLGSKISARLESVKEQLNELNSGVEVGSKCNAEGLEPYQCLTLHRAKRYWAWSTSRL